MRVGSGACVRGQRRPGRRLVGLLWISLAMASCPGDRPAGPPSLLLFVADTTRADAVSSYGEVSGTTPAADRLASRGLRYRHAFANAPWTLPSHVTLFTGLLPPVHGIDWDRPRAPEALTTLAEMLRESGYQTAGFSENPWVSETFGLSQGFEHFANLPHTSGAGLYEAIDAWLKDRDPDRPFLLFVNVMDAHWPFSVRDENRFLPAGVSDAEARALPQWPPDYICPSSSVQRAWQIQRGLYLGDVAAADGKLAQVRRLLDRNGATRGLVTVFTSDHGEHLGEHGLGGHQFSVREPLLRVPLVVHGLPDVAPAVIAEPVQLADLVPSVLAWTGLPARGGLEGRALPITQGGRREPRLLRADYRDPAAGPRGDEPDLAGMVRAQARAVRTHCGPEERVWGDMRAARLHPLKLVWFEKFGAELYDVEADPLELRDLAARRPELVRLLKEGLESGAPARAPTAELGAAGYIDPPAAP